MAFRVLVTIWLILFYHVWGPAWIEIHWNNIWLRVWSRMALHYTWGSVTTPHDFGGVLGQTTETFFVLWKSHGHGIWLVCEVALIQIIKHSRYPPHKWLIIIRYYWLPPSCGDVNANNFHTTFILKFKISSDTMSSIATYEKILLR